MIPDWAGFWPRQPPPGLPRSPARRHHRTGPGRSTKRTFPLAGITPVVDACRDGVGYSCGSPATVRAVQRRRARVSRRRKGPLCGPGACQQNCAQKPARGSKPFGAVAGRAGSRSSVTDEDGRLRAHRTRAIAADLALGSIPVDRLFERHGSPASISTGEPCRRLRPLAKPLIRWGFGRSDGRHQPLAARRQAYHD